MEAAILFLILENDDDRLKVEKLYEEYRKLLYKVAYNILKDKYAAEDAVQQTFIRIIDNLHKVDEKDCRKTKNFLVIICRNIALNLYNKRSFLDSDEFKNDLHVSDSGVDSIVVNKESLNHLLELICTLKPIYQEVLLLRFMHDYSIAEISSLLNIDSKTVQKRIERGRKNLLKLLEQH